jgi:hypothetical protein
MTTETTTSTAPAAAPKKAPRKTGAPRAEKTALKSLCSQLKIEPKAARRKLRKAGFSWHGSRERWVMTAAQLEKVREILKPTKQ